MKSLDASFGEDRLETSILVLIDDEYANARVLLRLQRVQEAPELFDSPHGRHDEVERRKLVPHGP